ncbi:hypothetical protein [Verminephrobacter eiseniae]|uniref:hypothetical protein n=1 Tax=Verminephrobacter eiseniae TaxID=364317 RepID=UPI002244EA86|nr:hypothetical protein [Verminephrobacter eiseniae]
MLALNHSARDTFFGGKVKSLVRQSAKQVYKDGEATIDNTKDLVQKLIQSKKEP